MACRARELVSLFLYKICNPRRSDYKIEEHVGEEAEAKLNRLRTITQVHELEADAQLKRLKTPLEKPEAQQRNMSEAEELKRSFRVIIESSSGSSSEKQKNQISNQRDFPLPDDLVRLILPRLAMKDNIRCSVVWKTWSEIAASARLKDPYWLMYLQGRP